MTPIQARIFLSHCGFEGDVAAVLEEIIDALPCADFKIMLDRTALDPGAPLKETIDDWLWNCDAAVVVVDARALDFEQNPWVFTEANRLQDRRESIEVIPLFVDGKSAADVKNKTWEPVGLNLPLGVEMARSETAAAAAVRVIEVLKDKTLRRVRTSGTLHQLAYVLGQFDADNLRRAAAPLKDKREWSAQRLKYEIADRMLDAPDYDVVIAVFAALARDSLDLAEEALYLVLPFTWVDKTAAAAIPAAIRAGRPVGLNATWLGTSEAYVARSAEAWPPWPVWHVDPWADTEHVHFKGDFQAQLDYALSLEEEVLLLGIMCDVKPEKVYIDYVQAQVEQHTNLGLLFLLGDLSPADLPSTLPQTLKHVEPKLDRHREEEARVRSLEGQRKLQYSHEKARGASRPRWSRPGFGSPRTDERRAS